MTTETDSPFRQIIDRICSGSKEAVFEFIEDYGPHIQRVVRCRLNQSLRAKFDSLDFVQMVWMTLFTDLTKISQFKDPEQLIAYLVVIARNKVVEESRRRLKYQKYNVKREAKLTASDARVATTARRNETPSAELIAREHFHEILNGKSERDRQVFTLRMEGATFDKIGTTLGISERTARQVMVDIEHACYAKLAEDSADDS
jgi:RNA polymerase sigma factor (sigma-70 family)